MDTRFEALWLQMSPCEPLICPLAAGGGNRLGPLTWAIARGPWKWGNGWGGAPGTPSCCKPQITAAWPAHCRQHPQHGWPRQPGTFRPISAISAVVTTISRLPKPAALPPKALLHSETEIPLAQRRGKMPWRPIFTGHASLCTEWSGSRPAASMVGTAQARGAWAAAERPSVGTAAVETPRGSAGLCQLLPTAGARGLAPTAPCRERSCLSWTWALHCPSSGLLQAQLEVQHAVKQPASAAEGRCSRHSHAQDFLSFLSAPLPVSPSAPALH